MDANSVITIISTVGFPIAMCLLMAWYIANENKRNNEQDKQYTEVLTEIKTIVSTLANKIDDILRKGEHDD